MRNLLGQRSSLHRGFTLIELMVTVAIVAILAAIALPSYTQYVRRSHRADAQTALLNVASLQQQQLLDLRSYASTLAQLNFSVPSSVSPYYTLTLVADNATVPTFTATATPSAGQAADTCSTLTVNSVGSKSPATCW